MTANARARIATARASLACGSLRARWRELAPIALRARRLLVDDRERDVLAGRALGHVQNAGGRMARQELVEVFLDFLREPAHHQALHRPPPRRQPGSGASAASAVVALDLTLGLRRILLAPLQLRGAAEALPGIALRLAAEGCAGLAQQERVAALDRRRAQLFERLVLARLLEERD
jgi:hypothetical protein